jgi:acid phosphatase (class A)
MRSEFRLVAMAVAGVLLLSSPALGAAHFLMQGQIDPALILPPPPDDTAAKAELAELDRIQAAMSDADYARAKADNDNETPSLFQTVLPGFDLSKLPATAHLLGEVVDEEKAVGKVAKADFHRPRPYIPDTALKTCETPDPKAQNSYPSGHAMLAFSTGVTLASLMPAKAQIILARAADYARNRLVCGMHYRSDIVAGQVLGTAVAVALLQNKDFRGDYDAASAELRAAGLQ